MRSGRTQCAAFGVSHCRYFVHGVDFAMACRRPFFTWQILRVYGVMMMSLMNVFHYSLYSKVLK